MFSPFEVSCIRSDFQKNPQVAQEVLKTLTDCLLPFGCGQGVQNVMMGFLAEKLESRLSFSNFDNLTSTLVKCFKT